MDQNTTPDFDQQTAQDLITAVMQQRESALNTIAQLQVTLLNLQREVEELKTVKTKDKEK